MRADKAGGGHNPSDSLRTPQPSTTKLSDSEKIMSSLTRTPESPPGGEYVEFELPADGTGNSLSVRPASGQATQVIGDLSKLGKKLHDSRGTVTTKRTQSEAGIGEEEADNQGMPKRQRTEDIASLHARALGNTNASQIRQPVSQVLPQPAEQPGSQPAPQPFAQPFAQPTAQPTAQPQVSAPKTTMVLTPDMQAQLALAEVLRMARSVSPFRPEPIAVLFRHLYSAQVWPLLKQEEQRTRYLMNMYSLMPAPYAMASAASAGMFGALNVPPSSSTTPTTQPSSLATVPLVVAVSTPTSAVTQGAPVPRPESITRPPVPITQTAPAASDAGTTRVDARATTASTLTSPPFEPFEDDADEGSDDAI